MIRVIAYAGYIFMLCIISGCDNRNYTLTIFTFRSDGKSGKEIHGISAADDSSAYVRAATLYLLSSHAYKKMSNNAKPYISKPVNFTLVDETGKSVDSIIGIDKATRIREQLKTLVN